MGTDHNNLLTAFLIISVVCGLFITSAFLRIKNSWKVLHTDDVTESLRMKNRLDLIFSSIVLIGIIIIYTISILNLGR